MKTRIVLAAAAAALVAACGSDTCPTAAAYPQAGQSPSCSGTPQAVQISLQMCEACSHTSPSCSVQVPDPATIFLDTRWEVCTDNSSCSAQACASATCQFAVQPGNYTVHALSQSGTSTFTLSVTGSATCSGTI